MATPKAIGAIELSNIGSDKGLCPMTGTMADVRTGVQVASAEARRRGLLVSEIVIPRPSRELFGDYL